MPKSARLSLKGLLIPFALAACLIAGYWFYWSNVAQQVEGRVRAALPERVVSAVKVTGFPYRLTLEVSKLDYKTNTGLGFQASRVVATASPFNPLLWVLEGALDPAISLPSGPTRPLKANNLKASIRMHPKGLERFSLTFDGLESQGPQNWQVGKGLFHLMTRFEDDDSLAMVADMSDVRISAPLEGPGAILGQTINQIRIAGPISQRDALMRSAEDWRDNGGKLTIMAGQVLWGPISLTNATGELSLSSSQKWQGVMSGQGALKPEGIAVAGLSAPVTLEIIEGRVALRGLPGINIGDAFR